MAQTRTNGFTLLEMIATLILTGVLMSAASWMLAEGVNIYIFGRENARLIQRVQLPLERLTREIQELRSVQASSATSLSFQTLNGARVVSFANGTLTLQVNGATAATLAENVNAFQMTYTDANGVAWAGPSADTLFTVRLQLTLTRLDGRGTQVYSVDVNPRNTNSVNSPG